MRLLCYKRNIWPHKHKKHSKTIPKKEVKQSFFNKRVTELNEAKKKKKRAIKNGKYVILYSLALGMVMIVILLTLNKYAVAAAAATCAKTTILNLCSLCWFVTYSFFFVRRCLIVSFSSRCDDDNDIDGAYVRQPALVQHTIVEHFELFLMRTYDVN